MVIITCHHWSLKNTVIFPNEAQRFTFLTVVAGIRAFIGIIRGAPDAQCLLGGDHHKKYLFHRRGPGLPRQNQVTC